MEDEDKCDECGKKLPNWRNVFVAEHQTDDKAPGKAYCKPACLRKFLQGPEADGYAYNDCFCDELGKAKCDCF